MSLQRQKAFRILSPSLPANVPKPKKPRKPRHPGKPSNISHEAYKIIRKNDNREEIMKCASELPKGMMLRKKSRR